MILHYDNCGWNCNGMKCFHQTHLSDEEEDAWETSSLCSTNTPHFVQGFHHIIVQRLKKGRPREVIALAWLRRQPQSLRNGRFQVARRNLRRQRVKLVADSHLARLCRCPRLGDGSFEGSPGGDFLHGGDHHRVDNTAAWG